MAESKDNNAKNQVSSTGIKNFMHGNMYQIKLLTLYLLRGIEADLAFELGTEMPLVAGKLDDIVFKYQVKQDDGETLENKWIFIQAKHKQNAAEKISANDLYNEKTNKSSNGDYELAKYFKSYHKEIREFIDQQPKYDNQSKKRIINTIEHCILVTNIGFDEADLTNKGFHLIDVKEFKRNKILNFNYPSRDRQVRLSFDPQNQANLFAYLKQNSEDANNLAKEIFEKIKNGNSKTHSATFSGRGSPLFKTYFKALQHNKVIQIIPDGNCIKFNKKFLETRVRKEKKSLRDSLIKISGDSVDALKNKEIHVHEEFYSQKKRANYSSSVYSKLPTDKTLLEKLAKDILSCADEPNKRITRAAKKFSSEYAPALIKNEVLQGKRIACFHPEFIRKKKDCDLRQAFKNQVESYWANDLLETKFNITDGFGKSEQNISEDDSTRPNDSYLASPLSEIDDKLKSSLALELIKQLTKFVESNTPISLRTKIIRDHHILLVKDKIIEIEENTNIAKVTNKDFVMKSLKPNAWKMFLAHARFTISGPYLSAYMNQTEENDDEDAVTELPTNKIKDTELTKFFETKLNFVINTPSEVELDDILNQEIGKQFNVFQSRHMASLILDYMLNWVKSKESNWLTSLQARKEIMNAVHLFEIQKKVTEASLEYWRKIILHFNKNLENYAHLTRYWSNLLKLLVNYIKFNPKAVNKMFFISSPIPKISAVALLLALLGRNPIPYRFDKSKNKFYIDINENEKYHREDSLLILKSKYITRDEVDPSYNKVLKTMQQKNSHFLLIIVLETYRPKELDIIYQFVRKFKGIPTDGKKIILIGYEETLKSFREIETKLEVEVKLFGNDNSRDDGNFDSFCFKHPWPQTLTANPIKLHQIYEAESVFGLPNIPYQYHFQRLLMHSKFLLSENTMKGADENNIRLIISRLVNLKESPLYNFYINILID